MATGWLVDLMMGGGVANLIGVLDATHLSKSPCGSSRCTLAMMVHEVASSSPTNAKVHCALDMLLLLHELRGMSMALEVGVVS